MTRPPSWPLPAGQPTVHPRWVRWAHWTNAVALAVMLFSGWQIYNADPFWTPRFPAALTLGGSLPGALQWHFAAMWVLAGNGLLALVLLVASGRLWRSYLAWRPRELGSDLRALLAARGRHASGAPRSAVQQLAYLGVLALLVLEVLSGLALWKPVQLQALGACFGGYEGTRRVHFAGMALLAGFAGGHVLLALREPALLLQMIGWRRRPWTR